MYKLGFCTLKYLFWLPETEISSKKLLKSQGYSLANILIRSRKGKGEAWFSQVSSSVLCLVI